MKFLIVLLSFILVIFIYILIIDQIEHRKKERLEQKILRTRLKVYDDLSKEERRRFLERKRAVIEKEIAKQKEALRREELPSYSTEETNNEKDTNVDFTARADDNTVSVS